MSRGPLLSLTGECLYIVTLGLCNITAKLPSEDLCSGTPENRSVAPKGDRGPRLRNPGLSGLNDAVRKDTLPHRKHRAVS